MLSLVYLLCVTQCNADISTIKRILRKEYASFFKPMERSIYSSSVQFKDPLTSFVGVDAYQNNVDMLGGRTFLGSLLFKESSISLHSINSDSANSAGCTKISTRWTLRTTIKFLPWTPTARFTGVSEYLLEDGKIMSQTDYWDSINLIDGKYSDVPLMVGVQDFFGQLRDTSKGSAELAAPELPYELLRRSKNYEVRRYPNIVSAETEYDQRPEGYDRLGSYAGGSNEENKKINVYSPTIMEINSESQIRSKNMLWPLSFSPPSSSKDVLTENFPLATLPKIKICKRESLVVGVTRFEMAATEPVVR
jgi:hypothetical protein